MRSRRSSRGLIVPLSGLVHGFGKPRCSRLGLLRAGGGAFAVCGRGASPAAGASGSRAVGASVSPAKRARRRATSAANASRAGARYFRESTRSGVLDKGLAHRGGEDGVEVRGDVDLAHPGGDAAADLGVGDARGAVEDERDGHDAGEADDEVEVETARALAHRVRAADGDGECIDAGERRELDGFRGVGADAGSMCPVLAADLPELGFDSDAAVVARRGPPRRSSGS